LVAGGGALTPDDAVACLQAGASLVEATTGFVYSGPGLPCRTIARSHRPPPDLGVGVNGATEPAVNPISMILVLLWAALGAGATAAGLLLAPRWLLDATGDHAPVVLSASAADAAEAAAGALLAASCIAGVVG